MINTREESTVVLKAHLILEDFVNVWASVATKTDDLFAGEFVAFKTKINIAKNLGLPEDVYKVLKKFNDVRNRYSHRRKYVVDDQEVLSLCRLIDIALPEEMVTPCREFRLQTSGTDASGNQRSQDFDWDSSSNDKKILISFVVFVMKISFWMQKEFISRGINYSMISDAPSGR